MRKIIVGLVAVTALSACANGDRRLDEFRVSRNAPLVIPPDYTLEPPRAGTVSTSANASQTQAIAALFGGAAPRAQGENAVLEAAGQQNVAPGVRSTSGDTDTRVVDKGAATGTIVNAPETDGAEASTQTPQ